MTKTEFKAAQIKKGMTIKSSLKDFSQVTKVKLYGDLTKIEYVFFKDDVKCVSSDVLQSNEIITVYH